MDGRRARGAPEARVPLHALSRADLGSGRLDRRNKHGSTNTDDPGVRDADRGRLCFTRVG